MYQFNHQPKFRVRTSIMLHGHKLEQDAATNAAYARAQECKVVPLHKLHLVVPTIYNLRNW